MWSVALLLVLAVGFTAHIEAVDHAKGAVGLASAVPVPVAVDADTNAAAATDYEADASGLDTTDEEDEEENEENEEVEDEEADEHTDEEADEEGDEEAEEDDADSEAEDEEEAAEGEDEEEEMALLEAASEFGPFQVAANVMPYNMAVDAGHSSMNPYLRGFNPHYDGFTPQPGGHLWNNPNGPYWSPFHWSAPSSYWSVYPPQYASHYVEPGFYGSHSPMGPRRGWHGEMDPHVYGPHLDWPFGGAISDINHIPGIGAGINEKAPFPQFRQIFPKESENAEDDADEADSLEVDGTNGVVPLKQSCVNCAYRD